MSARVAAAFGIVSALLAGGGCGQPGRDATGPEPRGIEAVVSEPVLAPRPALSAVGAGAVARDSVAYVSLTPGSAPGGVSAEIRNLATGFEVRAPLVNGGLDPVAVPAAVGDTLEIAVRDAAGSTTRVLVAVRARRPPVVVRADPPPKKIDVPLNSVVIVVFSEPIDPATLDTATVRLLRGASPVGGAVALRMGSELVAEFTPASALEPETTYQLVVTRGVRDRVGDSLEAQVEVQFTTGEAPPPINPPPPPPPLVFAALSAGGEHTCGLTADSAAYCWGSGYGQLGRPVPVASGLRFTSISAGGDFTCGLAAGAAYCWGSNFVGQLGNATTSGSAIPVRVVGELTFASLEAGWHHACGLTRAGAAYCWGFNRAGGVGDTSGAELCVDESFTTNPSPCNTTPKLVAGGLVFASVSPGWLHTCGVTAAGQAYCWGYNGHGQLGNGGTTDAYGPVAVAGGLTFASVGAGVLHTCGVAAGGAAYCWGSNLAGELGTQSVDKRRPGLVDGGHSFTSVTAGFLYTCAVASSARAYCWGNGATGALGNGSLDDTYIPVPVSDVRSLVAVSASRKFNYPVHTCGLTRGGEAYCWGRNGSGQLGDGTTANSAVPVRVVGPR